MKKLTVEDIAVPEAVELAVRAWANRHGYVGDNGHMSEAYMNCARIALLALAEQPIVPSEKQVDDLVPVFHSSSRSGTFANWVATEWQRRMFLKPQPDLPEEIKALMFKYSGDQSQAITPDERILKAYELGKKEGTR